MNNTITVDAKKLESLCVGVLLKAGVSAKLAKEVVHSLTATSLRGVDSHGIRLIPHYVEVVRLGRVNKKPAMKFKKTGGSTGNVDADHGFGINAGLLAMRKAIAMAKKSGIAAVSVGKSTHFSAAGIYALEAANHDMVGLAFTHSDALIVPHGGTAPVVGTNPIAFAVPCAGESPVILDMATSQISWNKLLMHRDEKKQLQSQWAVDREGVETFDPFSAIGLLPMGGYKGYGLALMVEIFSSLLTGMPFGADISKMFPATSSRRNLGHFFIAIDIKKFQPVKKFKERLKREIDRIRAQKPARGTSAVLVPGDPEKKMFEERSEQGIPLPTALYEKFIALAKEYKVPHTL